MPPRRQPNQAQQQLPSRVTAVRDLNHFDQLRNGSQLCVAIYTDTTKPQLAIISRALAELSQQPQFRHVTFAEIDISVDDIEEILDEQKIQEIPKLQAWKRGEVLTTCSGQPYYILEALKRHAGPPPPPKQRSRWVKALLGVGVVAAASLLAGYLRQRRGPDDDEKDTPTMQGLMRAVEDAARGILSQSELRVLKMNTRIEGLKRSVEEDMESYHKEQSLQEYEHFRGDTEEAKVDAFGKKIRDETRPDLGQLASQIERKVELLQGMYKRERELARRLPEPEERQSKSQEDLLHGGPWLYLKEKPRPAMDDDLYKWGVSKEAVEGTLGHQKQQQQEQQEQLDKVLGKGRQNQAASSQRRRQQQQRGRSPAGRQ